MNDDKEVLVENEAVLKRRAGEDILDWERRAVQCYPNEWIVLDQDQVICHTTDKEVARRIYGQNGNYGILPPGFNPPANRGVIRARQ